MIIGELGGLSQQALFDLFKENMAAYRGMEKKGDDKKMALITNPGTLRWLKLIHIICAAVWFGCSTALNIMGFCVEAGNVEELPGYSHAMLIVDNVLIYWGVIGVLGTGLIYGFCTKWGFFRQFWIKAKWLLTIAIIAGGTFITGPAIEGNVQSPGWYALNIAIFQKNLLVIGYSGGAQFLLLLLIFYLSVKKPSGK